jgi:predicted MFS family arabinose efflux permease
VQGNQVVSQRAIYALGPEIRSRLNGLYMAMFFLGGAGGSAVASIAYARGGWTAVCGLGVAFALAALALFATEARPRASGVLSGVENQGAGN